ncbi:hypothetical protein [Rhizobium herbae]|uniref:Lipoprotein n=1 Tax=Rhizobium herbae TaxID=508661 RepID=A0ABS4ES09_9HYPH|nr:hypothetical protein [Rhizobium herbae]MBP1860724.1 hypothetical protein [Rhizobium herbae]
MKIRYLIAVAGVSMCLSSCQSTNSYVKVSDGPDLGYAQAKCANESMGTRSHYVAAGSIGFVVGTAVASAVVNGIRQQEYMKNCMTMQGWQNLATRMDQPPRNHMSKNQSRPRFVTTSATARVKRPPTRIVVGM